MENSNGLLNVLLYYLSMKLYVYDYTPIFVINQHQQLICNSKNMIVIINLFSYLLFVISVDLINVTD